MRIFGLLVLAGVAASIIGGCSPKTPEEIEAAKYQKVQPVSPERQKQLMEQSSLNNMPGASKQ